MKRILLNLLAVVLVVVSGVSLSYDHITAYGLNFNIPQSFSLGLVGFTAVLAAADAVVQGIGSDNESNQAAAERDRAAEERERSGQERARAARRARIQNRYFILQIRHQLEGSNTTEATLRGFLALLEEYGE